MTSAPLTKKDLVTFSKVLALQYDETYKEEYHVGRWDNRRDDPVLKLIDQITSNEVGTYLFSGHRGVGKTTELHRFIKTVEEDNDVIAFYCDVSQFLNLNNPDISTSDLLFTLCAGLADAVQNDSRFGQNVTEEKLIDKLWRVLNTDIESIKLGAEGIANVEVGKEGITAAVEGFTGSIKLMDNPSFQQKLRDFTANSPDIFHRQVQNFIKEVVERIRPNPSSRVVLVMDSFERLTCSPGEENTLTKSLKEIFDHNVTRLRMAYLSVVYSVPPYLKAIVPSVEGFFTNYTHVSSFKVMQLENGVVKRVNIGEKGLLQMQNLIAKRFPRWNEVLTDKALQEMAWFSGGNLRIFFRLINNLLLSLRIEPVDTLIDIGHIYLEEVISRAASDYRFLTTPQVEWLKNIRSNPENLEAPENTIAPLLTLFNLEIVVDYVNGATWYGILPLVSRKYDL